MCYLQDLKYINKTENLIHNNNFKKLNRFIRICKRHSLTTYFVKSVIDSIQKNDGINISIPVDIYIEKSKGIGRHFSTKKIN